MKIVMCSSEVVPFAKTGGLADVVGALPLALEKLGFEVCIFMPFYKAIKDKRLNLERIRDGLLSTKMGRNCRVYFVENDSYFYRDGLYGDKSGDYPDNLDRFCFYCKRTIEFLKEINFKVDLIHCHDWQSAIIPVYLKTVYRDDPFYKNTKTLFTIHNLGYQGLFAKEEFPKLGLDSGLFSLEGLEFFGKVNLLKGGILFADAISTVSHTYSREIQTKEFGFGLEGVLAKRKEVIFGILNGIDYSIWNPASDPYIAANFSLDSLEGKAQCKRELQKICGFPLNTDIPLFGIVSRLAQQKGFDILAKGINQICRFKLQLVILGTGDQQYHILLENIAKSFPEVLSLQLRFDDPLAHKIYAGSDIFLMPSRYEPCGLGQLISLAYGTIPLVFKTGGLADTINETNGFIFDVYNENELVKTIEKAISRFQDKVAWRRLQETAMRCNFSWEESAKKYAQLYEKVLKF